MNRHAKHALTAAVAGTAALAGLTLISAGATPQDTATAAANLPCTRLVPADEFTRLPGTVSDTRCDLPNGQSVRVVKVSNPFALYRHTDRAGLTAARQVTGWAVIGTTDAIAAAGLPVVGGEF